MRAGDKKSDKPKRISSCDYAAWDKYDVDTEMNRIDLQDEQRQAEMKRIQERRKQLDKTNKATLDKTAFDKCKFVKRNLSEKQRPTEKRNHESAGCSR
jgi:outer membrane lipopolysaccharide assembly protein LptE/RlpB